MPLHDATDLFTSRRAAERLSPAAHRDLLAYWDRRKLEGRAFDLT